MRSAQLFVLQPDPDQPLPYQNASVWHHMSDALHQSLYRVLSLLISILPGILAFIVALGILTAIGVGLSALLRKLLTTAKFDDRLARDRGPNVADWSPAHSPTALAGRFAFWACVLLGLIIGVSAFDAAYSTGSTLSVSLLPYLTHSVGAILLLFAGNIIARFLARSVLIGAVNSQLQYARFLSLGVKWLVLVLTAAMVLEHLQIGGAVVPLAFGILFGGIVLTLSLAIGLGSRDLVSRSLEQRTQPPAADRPATGMGPTVINDPIRHF